MRILLIGSSAREHALAAALAASDQGTHVTALPGNAGVNETAQIVDAAPNSIAVAVAAFKHGIDLAVVDAQTPGAELMAAALAAGGTPCLGAGSFQTRTASRSWSLAFLAEHGLPCIGVTVVDDPVAAAAHAAAAAYPLRVSTDRTTGPSRHCRNLAAVLDFIDAATPLDGPYGQRLLFHPATTGPEVVLSFLTDGTTWHLLPYVRDLGLPDSASRGERWQSATTAVPEMSARRGRIITNAIVAPFHSALHTSGLDHRGAVSLRLALTPTGPKVLDLHPGLDESYAPLLLARLRTDLTELLAAAAARRLNAVEPQWSDEVAVSVTGTARADTVAPPHGPRAAGSRGVPGTAVFDGGHAGAADPELHRYTVVGTAAGFGQARHRALARAAWIHHDQHDRASVPAGGGVA